MLFSIVVPVYNVEKYIRECLDSLVNQSYSDYEVILVDDGSTDKSGKICDEYVSKDERFRVIHKTNEGLLLARRTGIKESKGEYILHCDSDDYIAIDTLDKIKQIIELNHPDMVMMGYNVVDDNHNSLEEHFNVFSNLERFNSNNKEKILNELASTTWLNNMVTKATRREYVDIDADYSEFKSLKMGEDLFQVVPLVRNCSSFVYIAEPLYFYRFNLGGMSKNINVNYIDNHILFSKRVYNLLIEENVTEMTMINFYNRYVLDLYKYLLRFLKEDIVDGDYKEIKKKVINDMVYKEAYKKRKQWNKANRLLDFILRQNSSFVARFLAKSILVKRI